MRPVAACALTRKSGRRTAGGARDADHPNNSAEQPLRAGIRRPHNERFVYQVTDLSIGIHTGMTQPIQWQTKETEMTRELSYYRLHIDLLRVSSALCRR